MTHAILVEQDCFDRSFAFHESQAEGLERGHGEKGVGACRRRRVSQPEAERRRRSDAPSSLKGGTFSISPASTSTSLILPSLLASQNAHSVTSPPSPSNSIHVFVYLGGHSVLA